MESYTTIHQMCYCIYVGGATLDKSLLGIEIEIELN